MQRILGLFLGLIVLGGCTLLSSPQKTNINSNTVLNQAPADVSFDLAYGQSTTVKGYTFTFLDLTEQTCAAVTGCDNNIQQLVELQTTDQAGNTSTMLLTDDPTSLWQPVGPYLIRLDNISPPQPLDSPANKTDYNISLTLTEQDLNANGNELLNNYDDIDISLKPVLYLYPPVTQSVSVQLDFPGTIHASYPEYDATLKGWQVLAHPDGHLINASDQQEYSYLFWEGESTSTDFNMDTGFVIAGQDTKAFLQNILPQIGLTPKEYNEFIVYWYPLLAKNPYNLIHFATDEYTKQYPLTITPTPDAILRVYMVYQPLTTPRTIEPQEFKPFVRQGFTAVEWGGRGIIKD